MVKKKELDRVKVPPPSDEIGAKEIVEEKEIKQPISTLSARTLEALKRTPVTKTLAALMYYPSNPGGQSFDDLPGDRRFVWYDRAADVMIAIDKLDMMLVKKTDPAKVEGDRRKHLDILCIIIQNLLRELKTTKPELFPVEELAIRIYDGKTQA